MEKERCKETVWDRHVWHQQQCSSYVWKDGYCKQHHPDTVKERNRKSEERFKEEMENSPWARLRRANKEIEELKQKISKLCPICR